VTDAPAARSRKTIGPLGLTFLTVVVLFILAWEYDWLTTPWWLKTVRYCGSLTLAGAINGLKGWLGW